LTGVETGSAERARALDRSPCDQRLAREQAAALVDADLAEPLAAHDRSVAAVSATTRCTIGWSILTERTRPCAGTSPSGERP
jgi:hypothetical protein